MEKINKLIKFIKGNWFMKTLIIIILLTVATSMSVQATEVRLAPYEFKDYKGSVDQSIAGYQGDTLKFVLEYANMDLTPIPEWTTLNLDYFKAKPLKSREGIYKALSYNAYYNLNVSYGYPLETLSVDLGTGLFGAVRVSNEANVNATKTELAIIYKLSKDRKRYCVVDQVTTRMMILEQYNIQHCLSNEVSINKPLVFNSSSQRAVIMRYSALSPDSITDYMSPRDATCMLRYLGIPTTSVPYTKQFDNDDCGYTVPIIDEDFMSDNE